MLQWYGGHIICTWEAHLHCTKRILDLRQATPTTLRSKDRRLFPCGPTRHYTIIPSYSTISQTIYRTWCANLWNTTNSSSLTQVTPLLKAFMKEDTPTIRQNGPPRHSVDNLPSIIPAVLADGCHHDSHGRHAVLPRLHIPAFVHEQLQQVPAAQSHTAYMSKLTANTDSTLHALNFNESARLYR